MTKEWKFEENTSSLKKSSSDNLNIMYGLVNGYGQKGTHQEMKHYPEKAKDLDSLSLINSSSISKMNRLMSTIRDEKNKIETYKSPQKINNLLKELETCSDMISTKIFKLKLNILNISNKTHKTRNKSTLKQIKKETVEFKKPKYFNYKYRKMLLDINEFIREDLSNECLIQKKKNEVLNLLKAPPFKLKSHLKYKFTEQTKYSNSISKNRSIIQGIQSPSKNCLIINPSQKIDRFKKLQSKMENYILHK